MGRKKLHINWRTIGYLLYMAFGITGVILLMGAISVKSSEQACREMRIMIVGEEAFVQQQDISAFIESNYGQMVGRTLNSLPIHEIEQQLSAIPYVQGARVFTDMNGVLNVQIAQRKAVLRVIEPIAGGFYVDRDGLKMPVSSSYIPRVPVASGHIPEQYGQPLDTVESTLVKDLFKIANRVENDSLWSRHIVQFYVNELSEIELIPRVGEHRILFGNGQDLAGKFEKLMVFYTGIVPKVGLDAYKLVNVKYKDQLICVRNPIDRSSTDSLPALESDQQLNNNNSLNIQ